MITLTVDIPAIYVVDMSDHPAIRGIRVSGTLAVPPLACASVEVLGHTKRWCSPPVLDIDIVEPFVCACGDCSLVFTVEGATTGTLVIETIEKSVFVPVMVKE